MSLALATRQKRLTVVRADIDTSGPGALHLHALPVAEPPTSAPLAVLPLALPCGVMDVDANNFARLSLAPVTANALASGAVGWGRYVDGAGVLVLTALAGLPGSGAPIIVTDGQQPPSASVFVGGQVKVLSAVFLE